MLDSARGSEMKAAPIQAMSAVKPMRLSFKHILGGEGDTSTAGSSPFKKRLNDIFSGGSGKCFAFEDIILNTQPNSPDKPARGGSPLRGALNFGGGPDENPPLRVLAENEVLREI